MRKFLSLILTLILLAGIITGCAGKKAQTAAPSGADNQNQTEAGSTQNTPAENGGKSTQQGKATISAGRKGGKGEGSVLGDTGIGNLFGGNR